jgi:hypothetical protein
MSFLRFNLSFQSFGGFQSSKAGPQKPRHENKLNTSKPAGNALRRNGFINRNK